MSQNNSSWHGALFTFPVTVSYVGVRSHMHALEAGGGVTFAYASFGGLPLASVYVTSNGPAAYGVAFVGYRLQPEGHAGLQVRVGAMVLAGNGFSLSVSDPPSYGASERFGIVPWGYLSVGASF